MNYLILLITSLAIILFGMPGVTNAQDDARVTDGKIPDWLRTNVKWWIEGKVSDGEFLSAINYLVENDIIRLSDKFIEEKYLAKYIQESEVKINVLEQENQKLAAQYDSLYEKYAQLSKTKSTIEQELQEEKISSEQERFAYEEAIKTSEKSQIEILAQTNPLLRAVIDGNINYYIEPIPYYAAPEVTDGIGKLNKNLNQNPYLNRVYSADNADLQITWIKDYGSHTVGEAIFKSHVKVGLGQTNCKGDWMPFDSDTVQKIFWHELGHSFGFDHSKNSGNIMYYETDVRFEVDEDKTITLDEGHYITIPFCDNGAYWYEISGDSKYNGFYVYVITPGTDPSSFLNREGGRYYPDCSTEESAVSFSQTCDIPKGSSLLIHNKDDLLQTDAIDIHLKIIDQNERFWPDMEWDMDALQYSDELIEYIQGIYG